MCIYIIYIYIYKYMYIHLYKHKYIDIFKNYRYPIANRKLSNGPMVHCLIQIVCVATSGGMHKLYSS
jgi:hypothetical protein